MYLCSIAPTYAVCASKLEFGLGCRYALVSQIFLIFKNNHLVFSIFLDFSQFPIYQGYEINDHDN